MPPLPLIRAGDAATGSGGRTAERWSALPRAARLLVLALAVLVVVGAGGLWLRDRAAERALAQRVDLTASLGVWSSSTAPPRGRVSYFLLVRNRGVSPVWVTSVEGSGSGLRLRTTDDVEQRVAAQDEAVIPLSVRLTCPGDGGDDGLSAEIAVRREDGGPVTRRVRPGSADLVLHVATTLCAARPDLRDQEISGPV